MRFSATEWKEFLEIGTRESSFDWDIPCGYITFGTCGMSIAKIIKKSGCGNSSMIGAIKPTSR